MWPTPVPSTGPSGWSALDRRGRILALLCIGVLGLAVVATSWLSLRGGQPSTPIYGGGSPAGASLWTWDGSTYTRVPIGGAGPSSNSADMAYDRARGVLVLWDHGCARLVMGFTGGCAEPVNETWTWGGRGWTARSTTSAPVEIGRGAMMYDSRLGEVVYVNSVGGAWSWSGSGWSALTMSGAPYVARPDSAAAAATFAAGYDEGRGVLVYVLSGSTWTWDGSSWTRLPAGIDVSEARSDAHLVYDRAHRQLVYVGSHSTWTWDGTSWQRHDQPAIASGTAEYDPARNAVLLVQQDASACDRTACRMTTWSWDARAWTRLSTVHAPELPLTRSGAFAPPMAFDESRAVMVLFASAS